MSFVIILYIPRGGAMRVPIIDIGNSKGIRIPQAVLKQVNFAKDIELEVADGRITLRRSTSTEPVPDFEPIPAMDDLTIQRMLRKINGVDLLTALVGADKAIKEAIYRNL